MTTRLSKSQLEELKGIVSKCRQRLADDLSELLEGQYGIRPDGTVEPISSLRLNDSEAEVRADLEDILAHFAAEDGRGRDGRERLLRETVFTHVNRLLAIRIAEHLELLPESIAQGRASRGFRDLVADVAPLLGSDETGGYWFYLGLCGDELAADGPNLFDPRNPLLALAPSPGALDAVIDILRLASANIWGAADTLGWAYQFFNTTDERREMREGGAPLNSRELAVRNQFFTPDYVVSYLVHNSLGRRLLEADPNSGLAADLDWLVDAPTERGEPIELKDVKVLDPACGSGHFLLGAYDVLELAWHHQGLTAAEAAPLIVPCLWGIDIDPRAAQVAAAAVVLRARRACGRTALLPRPNVVCARSLPPVPADELEALPPGHRQILEEIRDDLDRAPVLGSLLKLESVLGLDRAAGTAREAKKGMAPLSISMNATAEAEAIRAEVIDVVQRAADQLSSTAAERLTAAEAQDSLRFVVAVTQRYDAVLMNPPFGEPAIGTRPYIKAAYPWIPTKDHNLFAAFVGRGLELCNPNGYLGAITSRVGMFLTTFEKWRKSVLLGHQLVTLADLGFDVMEEAMVEAAAYVVGAARSDASRPATFLRMLREPASVRGRALHAAIESHRRGSVDDRVFITPLGSFDAVAGSPMAYWMSPSIRRIFIKFQAMEGHGADVRQGLATGDDFRFVRAFWEVDPRRIGRTREATLTGKRWVPFAKGGEYSPFWADVHLVLDFERDGERLRSFEGSRPQNMQYFFRPGLTWPPRTNSGFGIRILPEGCVFGHKGPAVINSDGRAGETLALLKSRLGQLLIDFMVAAGDETTSGGESRSYEVGIVQKLPNASFVPEAVGETALWMAEEHRLDDLDDETTRSFQSISLSAGSLADATQHRFSTVEDRHLSALDAWHLAEFALMDAAGMTDDALASVDEFVGRDVTTYPNEPLDPTDVKEIFSKPIGEIIRDGLADRGGARSIANLTFQVDRRLEVLSHVLQRHPEAVIAARRGADVLPPGTVEESARKTFSYVVGCAFGRWDVRIGRNPSLAAPLGGVFEPVALCSPGMLIDPDGMPARVAPAGYPLSFPPHRLLLDEAGHRHDIVKAITAAAEAFTDHPDSLLHELEGLLDRNVRDYLRRQFFKDHLGKYSKSRRKAPIYWPLYVPSRQWGVWVYAPELTRETLFAIDAAADQRLGSAITETRRLEAQQLIDGGTTTRELAQELERERKLAEELRLFQREARRIAETGWEPDLDDGIVLCAAPLAEVFLDWKNELTATRKELKRGDYEWASVSKFKAAL